MADSEIPFPSREKIELALESIRDQADDARIWASVLRKRGKKGSAETHQARADALGELINYLEAKNAD
jgi:hypothetical protein